MAKSWEEKFNSEKPHLLKQIEKDFADIPAGARMLIATPQIIADYLTQIPEGYGADVKKIRTDLANEYGAEYTCPVTTGIFLRTVAEFGYEQIEAGKPANEVPPFWWAIDKSLIPSRNSLLIPGLSLSRDRQKDCLPDMKRHYPDINHRVHFKLNPD